MPSELDSCGHCSGSLLDATTWSRVTLVNLRGDSSRSPDFVFTISADTCCGSCCGDIATSRTRPKKAPSGALTLAPSSSDNGIACTDIAHPF